MGMTTFSGPVRSTNGFMEPVTYIFATDVVGGEVQISATGNYILLSPADGGPASGVDLILPQVVSGPFTLANQPADPAFNGAQGAVYNYSGFASALKGYSGQKVNGATGGVVVADGYAVQWGGNGNQAAPWGAITTAFAPAV